MRPRPALAVLLAALALPAAAAPAAPPPREARPALALHSMAGTGACAAAHSGTTQVDNPCWLQFGLVPALRLGPLELGVAYEGRELLWLASLGMVQPPAATTVGATAAWVLEPSERWRLSVGAEAGWRCYYDFAGTGMSDRNGTIETAYLGAVLRAALGVRPPSGRADRLEVSVAVRSDLDTGHATVDGVEWTAGGWSFTMSLGLVSEW